VCPVKIDIHVQLYKWRQVIVQKGYVGAAKKIGIETMNYTLSHPWFYRMAGKAGRWVMRVMPFAVSNKLNPWYRQREMPRAAKTSFTDWYKANKQAAGDNKR